MRRETGRAVLCRAEARPSTAVDKRRRVVWVAGKGQVQVEPAEAAAATAAPIPERAVARGHQLQVHGVRVSCAGGAAAVWAAGPRAQLRPQPVLVLLVAPHVHRLPLPRPHLVCR